MVLPLLLLHRPDLLQQVARRRLQLGGVGAGVGRVLGRPRLGIEIQREIDEHYESVMSQLPPHVKRTYIPVDDPDTCLLLHQTGHSIRCQIMNGDFSFFPVHIHHLQYYGFNIEEGLTMNTAIILSSFSDDLIEVEGGMELTLTLTSALIAPLLNQVMELWAYVEETGQSSRGRWVHSSWVLIICGLLTRIGLKHPLLEVAQTIEGRLREVIEVDGDQRNYWGESHEQMALPAVAVALWLNVVDRERVMFKRYKTLASRLGAEGLLNQLLK